MWSYETIYEYIYIYTHIMISYHVTSHHIIYIISYRITSCHVMSYHIISFFVVYFCYNITNHLTSQTRRISRTSMSCAMLFCRMHLINLDHISRVTVARVHSTAKRRESVHHMKCITTIEYYPDWHGLYVCI